MGPEVVTGILAGLLIASLGGNVAQYFYTRARTKSLRFDVRRAEDSRRAAELRKEEQIDAMLARISTSQRIEVAPPPAPPVDPDEPKYVSDEPYHDTIWNDYRGEPEEDEA